MGLDPVVVQELLERVDHRGVVRGGRRFTCRRRVPLDGADEVRPEVDPRQPHPGEGGDTEAEGSALPRLLEDELAVVARQRTVLGQRRVDLGQAGAVQLDTASASLGTAVPIMQSRVTSVARASSPRSSVPGGRIGRTR